ncbi:NAD(P)-dependent oxidoreductase [Luteibacter aegosomatis]|uniref:NAD-dependent epimerase/dehydratase family protein n=1 Tax=Luteibacter aegosomatis TaxID=2911537 RepID=UPI001FFBBDD2|nr:NAD(P)-dependent oxidoreductase [Luteibacter aegosomatis]UPG87630.1 NAD(P)-dependent oxidoreductase [Luteibacter aegosomatis]
MKILVTGATGKVGSRLVGRLLESGEQVRVLVRDEERARAMLGDHVERVQGDLLAPDSLVQAVEGMDAVVHCAAYFRGATSEQAHATNDMGTRHLAEASKKASVGRFVFASTGLVYGPKGGALANEDDSCDPPDAYPLSKLAAERMLLSMDGLDVRILRFPFVYGAGDPHIQEVVPLMRGFPPGMKMSLGHHDDIAQAVIRLLHAKAPKHRIYNVVDDEAPDIAELFAAVGELPPDGSRAERAAAFSTRMDGRRIREDLGFTPIFPRFQDAVEADAL